MMSILACRAPVATVAWGRRTTTRRRYHSNTGPVAVTTSDCRYRPAVRYNRVRTTTHGRCKPCRTPSRSNTCRCSVRKRTCESTSNSTDRSTESYSLKVCMPVFSDFADGLVGRRWLHFECLPEIL